MERESNHSPNPRAHNRTSLYPSPMAAVETALAQLEPDGSVIQTGLSEETNQPFRVKINPYEPKPLEQLPQDIWCRELLKVATVIEKTCVDMGQYADAEPTPDKLADLEDDLKFTAHFLTAYRHDQGFLRKAASLVKISETGMIEHPTLPGGTWAFDPKNIEFRHAPLRIDGRATLNRGDSGRTTEMLTYSRISAVFKC